MMNPTLFISSIGLMATFSGLALSRNVTRRVRVRTHRAAFTDGESYGPECYFINITNLSLNREIEVTHVWFKGSPEIHIVRSERPLPKRLKVDETWETWVFASELPAPLTDEDLFKLARVRLSSGRVFRAKNDKGVPSVGRIPGGEPLRDPTTKLNDVKQQVDPEVVLLAPISKHFYRWVPEKEIGLYQAAWPFNEQGTPIFGLRNLSGIVVTAISVEWNIITETSIDRLFLSSDYFKQYNASFKNGLYFLTKASGHGSGAPAADQEVTTIPYCKSNDGPDQRPIEAKLPNAVSNSYALRITATKQRPPVTNEPDGYITTNGPLMRACLRYTQAGKQHVRTFVFETSVMAVSDSAHMGSGNLTCIENAFWSDNNFRAVVTFSLVLP